MTWNQPTTDTVFDRFSVRDTAIVQRFYCLQCVVDRTPVHSRTKITMTCYRSRR
ncbi:hypothetical protein PISMIDRAFT_677227 [Pisolithus microcarpus 441]|uniref:Uncharacterized protein n=1 Tax=Pisolithus microcarpus 441 TaxID=765257 RepID=A0A0C9Z8F8_9AGAM|nr:hypothetical protein PISMIDRAFT_677227 [Pisolithus microcarpus 441]